MGYVEYSQQKLFTGTAQQNRLNGVQGHTMLGVLLAGNATNIVSGIGNMLAGNNKSSNDVIGSANTQEETEDITQDNNTMADFRTAYDAFIKSPTTENAKKLKNLYEETKDKGTFKSYARLYESHQKEIDDALKKKSA